jgi:hypothetical protein
LHAAIPGTLNSEQLTAEPETQLPAEHDSTPLQKSPSLQLFTRAGVPDAHIPEMHTPSERNTELPVQKFESSLSQSELTLHSPHLESFLITTGALHALLVHAQLPVHEFETSE